MFASKVCVCRKKRGRTRKIGRKDSSRQENLGHDSDPLMNPPPPPLWDPAVFSTPPPPATLPSPLPPPVLAPYSLCVCVCARALALSSYSRQVKFPDLTLTQVLCLTDQNLTFPLWGVWAEQRWIDGVYRFHMFLNRAGVQYQIGQEAGRSPCPITDLVAHYVCNHRSLTSSW